jgi:1-deoxy-D-xylulose-5-phosphate reductoisomerase
MKKIAVLGSTGSVGTATMAVVEACPDRFAVVALAAGRNLDLLRRQIAIHRPEVVSVSSQDDARALGREFADTRCVAGRDGILEVAGCESSDMLVSAFVGSVGLMPTVAAIRQGKDIALANKESMVAAGELISSESTRANVNLLPVDSEHVAIHQALGSKDAASVSRLILTASGGPFRTWTSEEMTRATISDALAHPTWQMGRKISVDSATMMNKGLEIIEAHHFFGTPENRIDVIIHPESIVHSMVEFADGSVLAQLSPRDMRVPILYALSWPERVPHGMPGLDLAEIPSLTFEKLDAEKFPAPGLARSALRAGGEMPAVLSAANETAVASFLDGHCPFSAIIKTVAATLDRWAPRNRPLTGLEQAIATDAEAKALAREELRKYQPAAIGSENRC